MKNLNRFLKNTWNRLKNIVRSLLEAIVESDDNLMEKYLEGEDLTKEEIKGAIRKMTCQCKLFPVTCGSSYKNKGVQPLLDAIIDYMPSPLDVPAIKGTNPETGEEEERPSDDNARSRLWPSRSQLTPYVGRLAFFRVYSGTLNAGSCVYNANKEKRERIGRILRMHSNHRTEITMYTLTISLLL